MKAAQTKTKANDSSVAAYLAAISDPARRKDCEALASLMARASGQPGKMWGTSIVGFGTHHYRYESGREGEICAVGFSSRKGDISIYGLHDVLAEGGLLPKLGRHKLGKGCLYVRALEDVDLAVLEKAVAKAAKVRSSPQR